MTQKIRPKALLLSTTDGIGGMNRIVCVLATGLAAQGWNVQTVFPQMQNREALLAWCREQGVEAETNPAVLDIVSPHTRRDLLALQKFVRDSQADVVHMYYGESYISLKDVLAVRLAGRRRCVVTVCHPTPWASLDEQKRKMTGLAGRLCHSVVSISQATRRVLREAGIPGKKIEVIPCGLRVPTHLPSRAEARTRLGLPATAFVVGSVSRLVAHKGLADLIQAMAGVPDPDGQMLLAIAGEGSERPSLEALAASRLKDRAIFLGLVPDVNDFYAACDVFALPSHMEGFGLVYVEAAFHGIPSIGTLVGGVPEAVEDGKTGLLVSVSDIPALTTAIKRLRDDTGMRRNLGEAARARACSEFTETVMAERYEKAFRL